MNIIQEHMQLNTKLFPIYKMLSWDLLFYYAISFLFLTQVKEIDAFQVVLANAIYTLAYFLFQIPTTIMIEKFGKRKSLILGNLLISIYVVCIIIAQDINMIYLANIFAGFGFVLKSITETDLLYDSIPISTDKGKKFASLDAKGSSLYYYLEAFSCFVTGFLYLVNPFLPIIVCLIFTLLSTFLATRFYEIIPLKNKRKRISFTQKVKEEVKELKYSFRSIFQSPRLKSLLLFYAVCSSIIYILGTYQRSLLTDLNITADQVGIIFAMLGIIAAIAVKKQQSFHNIFKNKSLTILSLCVTFSMIVTGIICLFHFSITTTLFIVFLMYVIQYIAKGPFYTLSKRYLGNFANSKIRTRILSANDLVSSFVRITIIFFASFLLKITTTAYAFALLGCIFTILMIFILTYMKPRIGLKPEQYKKEDINLVEIS